MESETIIATLPYVKGFISLRRYIQGPGVIKYSGKFIKIFGKRAFVFADEVVMGIIKDLLSRSFKEFGIEAEFEVFRRECSWEEINRLSRLAEKFHADVVVGAGGGKAIDIAKAVGNKLDISVVCLPTIASTDAPTSALSVIYTEPYPGEFLEYKF